MSVKQAIVLAVITTALVVVGAEGGSDGSVWIPLTWLGVA